MADGLPYGPYNLIKRLAVGGMAEVFLARPRGELGAARLVVVKRMLPLLSSDPEISRMFLDEARIAAQLAHPFLTQVFDVGNIDGTFYIAMDYVHGVNVKDLLSAAKARGQPVPWTLAVRLAISLCEVLEYVHELKAMDGTPLQLVHRDITPSNIMVTYTGAPKLVDFGIARAAQRLTETKPGVVKGKLLYAAPEQYTSRQADARTDLYGLAICLYEMLVGDNPFAAAQTPFEAANMVAKQTPPSVLGPRPDVPRKLADAIAAGLEKDPAKRPHSAGEFRRRLEASIAGANAVVGMPELARWMAQLYPGRAALDHTRHSEAKEEVPTQREQLAGGGATLPLRVTPEKGGAVLVTPPSPPAKHEESAAPSQAPVLMPLPQALRHSGEPFAQPPELPPELPTKIDPGSAAPVAEVATVRPSPSPFRPSLGSLRPNEKLSQDERSRSPTEGEVPVQPVSTPEQVALARASISRLPHAGAPPAWNPESSVPAPHEAKEFPAADPHVNPDAPTLEPPPNYPAAVLAGPPRKMDVKTVPLKTGPAQHVAEVPTLDVHPVRTDPEALRPAELAGTTGSTTLPQTRRASRWPRRLAMAVVVLAALGASAYAALQLRHKLETPVQRAGP